MLKSSAAQAGTLIGLDKNCAFEMVEAGGILTEYDKLIDRQIERAAITQTAGFAKIFTERFKNSHHKGLINSTERKPEQPFSGKGQNDKRKYGALQGKKPFRLDNAALASLNCVCHLFLPRTVLTVKGQKGCK